MTKLIILAAFTITSIGFALEVENTDSITDWHVLQEGKTWVGWTTYEGYPLCQARTSLPFSLEKVSAHIESVEAYPDLFERITETRVLENDVVHVLLDMPFPFAGRDYIIQYTKSKNNERWVFNFKSVTHVHAPENSSHVRLVNAGGEWILTPAKSGATLVTYSWNGELLGDFPNWGLTRAWKTQGTEVLDWLRIALEND